MSVKHSHTTADYIDWDSMLNIVRKLYKDRKYRLSLLLGCGCFTGLRISDLLRLTWAHLLNGDKFVITEKKTSKRREIRINKGFQEHIKDCHKALGITDDNEFCFLNKYGSVMSIQMVNRHLKTIKEKYGLKIEHISSHSFRKTFGRKVVQNAGEQSQMALIKLSEIYNHESPMVTRRYLGLRAEELEQVYDGLDF